MRSILIAFYITSLTAISAFGQIEALETDQDVENLIIQNFDFLSFHVDKKDSTYQTGYWYTGDFNSDGQIDLFVYGTGTKQHKKETYKVSEMSFILGGKKLKKVTIPSRFYNSWFTYSILDPNLIQSDNADIIGVTYQKSHDNEIVSQGIDSIYVMHNEPMIYSKNLGSKEITSVTLERTACYGTCPVFELTINSDKKTSFNGIKYTKNSGEFELLAEKDDWEYISTLLNNINVDKLDSTYFAYGTDQPTGYLSIKFNDGTEKSIEDYGLAGTAGLDFLYQYLTKLTEF